MMAVTKADGTNMYAAEAIPSRQALGSALHNFIVAPAPACNSFGLHSQRDNEYSAPKWTWSASASSQIESPERVNRHNYLEMQAMQRAV